MPRRTGRSKIDSATSGTPSMIVAPPVTTTPAVAASSRPASAIPRATRVRISSTRAWTIRESVWRERTRGLRPPMDGTSTVSSSRTRLA